MGPQSKSGFCLSWKGKCIIKALEGFTGASITTLLRWRGRGGAGGEGGGRGHQIPSLGPVLPPRPLRAVSAPFPGVEVSDTPQSGFLCGVLPPLWGSDGGRAQGPPALRFHKPLSVLLPTWGSAGRQGVWVLSPGSPRSLLFPALKEIFLPQISILIFCFYISLVPGV